MAYRSHREVIGLWYDIEIGKPIRIINAYGQELDRTIVDISEKTIIYQRHEVEDGKVSTINKKRFMELYKKYGVPYEEGRSGDLIAAFWEPDFEFDEDEDEDEDEGQLAMFKDLPQAIVTTE